MYNNVRILDYAIRHHRHYNIDMQSTDGFTPLHTAAYLNNFDSVNLLLEKGADLLVENKEGSNTYGQLIIQDHSDLLECVYPQAIMY
jgi:ankyrin repeat protein